MDVSMPERDVKDLQQCPRCAAPIDNAARCWTCGHEIAPSEPKQDAQLEKQDAQLEASDKIPIVDWKEPEATTTLTVQAKDAAPAGQPRNRSMALVGGAGVLACVTAMVVLQSLQPAASPQPIDTVRPSSPAPVAAAPVVESAPAPMWVGSRQAAWARDGSKTISFELQATHDVSVWMAKVRPVLVVRCLYRTTEVFVATQSAATIEGQSGSHTVRLNIDDDREQVQQWTDSDSGHELFSPNGIALVRRLATAQRLRFSFAPYNANPVTAEFAVRGFETLAGLVGNTCGWKLDESSQTRTAHR